MSLVRLHRHSDATVIYENTNPTRHVVVKVFEPAGDDNDVLGDVGHLLDGQVAHPPQCLLRRQQLHFDFRVNTLKWTI